MKRANNIILFTQLILSLLITSTILHANISVINGLSHEYQTSEGNVIEGQIEIKNHSENLTYINIYQTDYHFNHHGEIFYDQAGENERSNAEWIELSADYVPVEGNGLLKYKFKIEVPEGELIGSYWSIIMVEGVMEPDTSVTEKTVNIQTVVRYGVQVITQIENSGSKNLDFLDVQLVKENGQHFLNVDIINNGEQYLKPYLKLELYNSSGFSAGSFESKKRKIYPGTSVRLIINLEDTDPGLYESLLIAETGDDEVFGVNLTLDIPEVMEEELAEEEVPQQNEDEEDILQEEIQEENAQEE